MISRFAERSGYIYGPIYMQGFYAFNSVIDFYNVLYVISKKHKNGD